MQLQQHVHNADYDDVECASRLSERSADQQDRELDKRFQECANDKG